MRNVHALIQILLLIWLYDDWRLVCWFCQLAFIVSYIRNYRAVSQCQLRSSKWKRNTQTESARDLAENQVNKNDFIIHTIHCSNVIQKLHTKSAVNSIYLHTRRAPFFFLQPSPPLPPPPPIAARLSCRAEIHFTGLVESVTFILFHLFVVVFPHSLSLSESFFYFS